MSALKWAALLAGLLSAYPCGRLLRRLPRLESAAWFLAGLLPFLGTLDIGLVTDVSFAGDSHGLEVALLDWLALVLVCTRPLSLRRVPYRATLALYLRAAAGSALSAVAPVQVGYYAWKLLRGYLLFLAVARAGGSLPVALALLRGMAAGAFYEFYLVMQQRYSVYQSPGSFAHQNSLGMAMNLCLVTVVALLLARRSDWLVTLAPGVGLIVVLLTRSRGALIFLSVGVGLVFVLSSLRRFTGRKALVAVLGATLAAGVLSWSARRVVERFERAPAASMDTRRQFEEAAAMMLRDHPWGVGANHFSWSMRHGGYADRAGLTYGDRVATVHNLYWLTAAELGWFGLAALLLMLVRPLVDALRGAWRAARGDLRGDLLLGLGVALLACYLHSTVEWIWRDTEVSYVFWTVVALAGSLAAAVRRDTPRRARQRRPRGAPGPLAAPSPPAGAERPAS